jgi:7,8-dihydroneopterin aldolase/epimerase/oxygenase
MTPTKTLVLVEGFRVDGYVGHQAPERKVLQPIDLDIVCTLTDPEVSDDELENSFDYIPLLDTLRALAQHHPRRLIETFAEEIARECFACTRVADVTVSVRKPNKFPGVAAVGTTRHFTRDMSDLRQSEDDRVMIVQ